MEDLNNIKRMSSYEVENYFLSQNNLLDEKRKEVQGFLDYQALIYCNIFLNNLQLARDHRLNEILIDVLDEIEKNSNSLNIFKQAGLYEFIRKGMSIKKFQTLVNKIQTFIDKVKSETVQADIEGLDISFEDEIRYGLSQQTYKGIFIPFNKTTKVQNSSSFGVADLLTNLMEGRLPSYLIIMLHETMHKFQHEARSFSSWSVKLRETQCCIMENPLTARFDPDVYINIWLSMATKCTLCQG